MVTKGLKYVKNVPVYDEKSWSCFDGIVLSIYYDFTILMNRSSMYVE